MYPGIISNRVSDTLEMRPRVRESVSSRIGLASHNSLRIAVLRQRMKSMELYKTMWRNIKKKFEPHFSGVKAWRAAAILAFGQVGVILFLSFLNAVLVQNGVEIFRIDFLPIYNISDLDYRSLWRAHAAVISVTFIAIVFLYEFISGDDTNQFAAKAVVKDTRGVQIISFSILANGAMAFSTIFLPTGSGISTQSNILIINTFRTAIPILFFVTILLILFLYARISAILLEEGIGNAVERRGKSDIDRIISSDTPRDVELNLIRADIPEFPSNRYYLGVGSTGLRLTGDDIDVEGSVSDINLKRLHQVFLLAQAVDAEVLHAPRLGDEIDGDSSVFALDRDIDRSHHSPVVSIFNAMLEDAIVTRSSTRWTNV